jgi:hypothetical protein
MLELAVLFLVISAFYRPFGDYANVANATLSIAGIFAVAWLIAGAVAFVLSPPPERRLLHHA